MEAQAQVIVLSLTHRTYVLAFPYAKVARANCSCPLLHLMQNCQFKTQ